MRDPRPEWRRRRSSSGSSPRAPRTDGHPECLRRAEAAPRVVSGDVDVRPVRLLRAWWCPRDIDVWPEEVLDPDEVAGRVLEDEELVRRSAVRETGSSR